MKVLELYLDTRGLMSRIPGTFYLMLYTKLKGLYLVLIGETAPVVSEVFTGGNVCRDNPVKVRREDDPTGANPDLSFLPSTSL